MKIYSYHVTTTEATLALNLAKRDGKIASDIYFDKLEIRPSRTKRYSLTVKLGATDKTSGPNKSRYWANTGTRGAGGKEYGHYAATYDEWGWFYAYVYAYDPNATIASMAHRFENIDDFRIKTDFKYIAPGLERFAPIPSDENKWR